MKREDQVYLSSMQLWNGIDTPIHQSTNLFSQKFKESQEFGTPNTCPHHPQKKVKYILVNETGQKEKLCTKCAVLLAQQGHKIENIEEDNVRKKQTDSFIEQLLLTKSEIDNVHSNLLSQEASLKKFYNDQYTQVVKTFAHIEKQLQKVYYHNNQCKSQLLVKLSDALWSGVQMTNQLKVQSKQIEHQLGTYVNDIKHHYDKIVQMGTLPFNQIMGGYSSKLFKLQQCMKEIQDKKTGYLHYDGKQTNLDSLISELSSLTHRDQPLKKQNRESTRSSSEQRTSKSAEKEKRHQSQPIGKDVKSFDNSEKKTTQTFKITEESIEEWMENSTSKQRHTEPAEQTASPNILAMKCPKKLPPSRASMKQETNQALLDKLLSELSQIKKERALKKQSKTPELGKTAQNVTIPNKLSPKFLYKNYYK